MIKEAIEKIISLATVQQITIDERLYTTGNIKQVNEPETRMLECHTISGIIPVIFARLNKPQNVTVIIDDYDQISVISDEFGPFKQRETFIRAMAYHQEHLFDKWMALQDFIIYATTSFIRNKNIEEIVRISSNVVAKAEIKVVDNGFTDNVTVKNGVHMVDTIDIPNPVTLQPFMTFPDIEQPDREFSFRLRRDKERIECALFASRSVEWKNTTIIAIAEHVKGSLLNAAGQYGLEQSDVEDRVTIIS